MFIGREIRRSHAFRRGEQAAKLGVTPKSLFGDLLEINKRRAVLREFALKFGQSCVVAFERFGSAPFGVQQAFLGDIFLAAFVVLNSLKCRAIAGLLSLVDSRLSLLVLGTELCLSQAWQTRAPASWTAPVLWRFNYIRPLRLC